MLVILWAVLIPKEYWRGQPQRRGWGLHGLKLCHRLSPSLGLLLRTVLMAGSARLGNEDNMAKEVLESFLRNCHMPSQHLAVNPEVSDSSPELTETSHAGGSWNFQGTKEGRSISIWGHVERKHEWASGSWGLSKAWGAWKRKASMGSGWR